MRVIQVFLLSCMFFLFSGFYFGIKGTVVDDETKEPIEGAVVAAQWNKTKGPPGLTNTVTIKVVETVTDMECRFFIS